MEQYIVAVGDPVKGYDYYGTFESEEDAHSWVAKFIPSYEPATVIYLESPEDGPLDEFADEIIEGEVIRIEDIAAAVSSKTLPVSRPLEPEVIKNSKGKVIGTQTVIPGA